MNMRNVRRWLAVLLLTGAYAVPLQAQQTGSVTGTVTEQTNLRPIAGAHVSIAGSSRSGITDERGRYMIPGVPTGTHEVRVSTLGYAQASERVTVTAGQQATVNFTLAPSAIQLSGVVVSAAGREERRRELGNSVAQIQIENIELAAVNNMASLLQGRTAGVTVMQSGGTTGSGARIRIRGSNSVSLSNEPLLIVDGVRVNNSPASFTIGTGGQSPSRLNDFNPEDIESIEILKGPAASALYGTAAANGVIQITTKRGRAGATRWNFFSELGDVREVTQYEDNVADDLEFCAVYNQAMGQCTVGPLTRFNPLMNPDTRPFRTGSTRKVGLNASGGGDATQFYFSAETDQERGIFRINTLERFNLRANVNSRLTDALNLAVRMGFNNNTIGMPQNDNNFGGVHLNGNLGHPDTVNASFGGYYQLRPSEFFEFLADQEVNRLTGGMNFNYQPTSWLSFVGTSGLDLLNRHDEEFNRPNQIFSLGPNVRDGIRRSHRVETRNLTNTLDATARFVLRDGLHNTTSGGVQYNTEDYHDTRGFGVGVVPGTRSLSGTTKLYSVQENTIQNRLFGAYLGQQFALYDRLFLSGSLRGDQNSAFGTDIGFVVYPSVSASWVVSEESFFPELGFLSSLRLRSAFGQSGLKPSYRDAFTFFEPVAVRVQNVETPGITLGGAGNPELRPEVVRELEFGFDAALLQERLGLEVTLYNRHSKDALIRRRLPPSVGATATRFENVGSVSNRGVEALLNARVLDTRTVTWEATLSASRNSNNLDKLGEGIEPILFGLGSTQRHVEGFPLGGYWQRPLTYTDANGDGLLQRNEVTIGDTLEYMGTPFPRYEASFSSGLTLFSAVRINALLDYKGGHKLLNYTEMDRCAWEMVCEKTYNREVATINDQLGWMGWNLNLGGFGRNVSAFVEDASFVKLREVSASFTIPQRYVQRLSLDGARLTIAGRNLKTWTKYSGYDPEVNTAGQADFTTADYHNQPPVRFFTTRIDINF
jgi:TonB-dependent starch-binding outer membrane protein SusC